MPLRHRSQRDRALWEAAVLRILRPCPLNPTSPRRATPHSGREHPGRWAILVVALGASMRRGAASLVSAGGKGLDPSIGSLTSVKTGPHKQASAVNRSIDLSRRRPVMAATPVLGLGCAHEPIRLAARSPTVLAFASSVAVLALRPATAPSQALRSAAGAACCSTHGAR